MMTTSNTPDWNYYSDGGAEGFGEMYHFPWLCPVRLQQTSRLFGMRFGVAGYPFFSDCCVA